MAAILQFRLSVRRAWSPSEQAEFARTAAILAKSGLPVICETGVSDEGDPWVVFLREDTGDVVAHIARIDGQIVAASAATNDVVTGPNFRAIMERIVRTQPLVMPSTARGDRLYLHPSAVIVAFVATALAYMPEEDIRPYARKWKLLDDGTVAYAAPDGRSSPAGGILRDGLLAKAEAARLGLDGVSGHISDSLVVAAPVAAAAVVVQSSDFWSAVERRTVLPDQAEQVDHHEAAVVRQDANAQPDPTHVTSMAAAVSGADGSSHVVQGASENAVVTQTNAHDAMATLEAHHADVGQEQVAGFAPVAVYFADAPAAGSMTLRVSVPDFKPEAHREAPATSQTDRAAELSVADPPPSSTHADVLAAPLHTAATAPVVTISSQASELVSMLFSSRPGPVGSFVTTSLGDVTLSFASSATSDGVAATAATGSAHTSVDATASAVGPTPQSSTPTATGKSGYELIGDILGFAFDPAHQVASPGGLAPLQQALHDRISLPAGDRVLIIDVPDLHNDIFNFSDGVTMMSLSKAQQLLPNADLHAQTELLLANGTTLKLIGVVDIQHAGAAAVVAHA